MSNLTKVEQLYTPLKFALGELERRRSDTALREKVATFFEPYPRFSALHEPKFVMSPALATPNLEMLYFMDMRDHLPLATLYLEYRRDKFVHLNVQKRSLGQMFFYQSTPDGQKKVIDSMRVVDFDKYQGRPMDQVITTTGETLPDFHHRLVYRYYTDRTFDIIDFSDWFSGSYAFMPEFPYLRYLGLFITDSILFSNFTTAKHEEEFTERRVLPAFEKLREIFGVKPLIVPAQPAENDDLPHWCYYPIEVKSLI